MVDTKTTPDVSPATFPVHLRTAEDEGAGIVKGLATTFARPYSLGDGKRERIEPGAFAESIRSRPVVPVYDQHGHRHGNPPIGSARLRQSTEGVRFKARLYIEDSERARVVWRAAKDGAVREVSMGFKAHDVEEQRGGLLVVRRGEIREISFVLVPANPDAVIESVRAAGVYTRSRSAARQKVARIVRKAAKHEPSGDPLDAVYRLLQRREFRELLEEAHQ